MDEEFPSSHEEEDTAFESESWMLWSVMLERQQARKLSRPEIESAIQARPTLSIQSQYFLDRP